VAQRLPSMSKTLDLTSCNAKKKKKKGKTLKHKSTYYMIPFVFIYKNESMVIGQWLSWGIGN
jgi:hypothetical protein